jgi:hypothetical protein
MYQAKTTTQEKLKTEVKLSLPTFHGSQQVIQDQYIESRPYVQQPIARLKIKSIRSINGAVPTTKAQSPTNLKVKTLQNVNSTKTVQSSKLRLPNLANRQTVRSPTTTSSSYRPRSPTVRRREGYSTTADQIATRLEQDLNQVTLLESVAVDEDQKLILGWKKRQLENQSRKSDTIIL